MINIYNCLIFGVGSAYINRRGQLNFNYINIIGLLDNDKTLWGDMIDGSMVDNPDNISEYNYDYILITSSYFKEIKEQLLDLGVNERNIININTLIEPTGSWRHAIVNNFIRYDDGFRSGIEIGGANCPIHLMDKRIIVKQVDYCDHSQTNSVYSKLELVKVDIIDDGERLETLDDGSQDFIIACHMIEHCKNPIGTLRVWLKKLRKDGIIYLAIPDKRYTFDKPRRLTTIEYFVMDDKNPSIDRDKQHYFDIGKGNLSEEEKQARQRSLDGDERIHFHVWDADSFIEFINEMKKYFNNNFYIEQVGNVANGIASNEIICVLRKVK